MEGGAGRGGIRGVKTSYVGEAMKAGNTQAWTEAEAGRREEDGRERVALGAE